LQILHTFLLTHITRIPHSTTGATIFYNNDDVVVVHDLPLDGDFGRHEAVQEVHDPIGLDLQLIELPLILLLTMVKLIDVKKVVTSTASF
jgi:hypothetical protein